MQRQDIAQAQRLNGEDINDLAGTSNRANYGPLIRFL
jgi:hypothetical protein